MHIYIYIIATFLSEKIKVQSVFDRKCTRCDFGTARFAAWMVCHLSATVIRHLSARVVRHLSAIAGFEVGSP